uniref:Unclassified n=1 Tax=Fusarium clavum TaxID=2594811 RepID=W1ID02_9HYPO|nr:unclassified [Fusarium clavum]CEF82620.1 unclassified [Fusarium clavum]
MFSHPRRHHSPITYLWGPLWGKEWNCVVFLTTKHSPTEACFKETVDLISLGTWTNPRFDSLISRLRDLNLGRQSPNRHATHEPRILVIGVGSHGMYRQY